MNRRRALATVGRVTAGIGLSTSGLWLLYRLESADPDRLRPSGEPSVLRPPGAITEADFLACCIRCQRCQDACPRGAIRLASPGDRTYRGTPFILPASIGCDLCLECTRACPSGALQPVTQKEEVRMGVARVDERTCVSHNRTGVCGACHTACPLRGRAITQGLHNAPTVHADRCVGCGLCEEACILAGVKAIRVFSGRGEA